MQAFPIGTYLVQPFTNCQMIYFHAEVASGFNQDSSTELQISKMKDTDSIYDTEMCPIVDH